jgi:hypothetical protein
VPQGELQNQVRSIPVDDSSNAFFFTPSRGWGSGSVGSNQPYEQIHSLIRSAVVLSRARAWVVTAEMREMPTTSRSRIYND